MLNPKQEASSRCDKTGNKESYLKSCNLEKL